MPRRDREQQRKNGGKNKRGLLVSTVLTPFVDSDRIICSYKLAGNCFTICTINGHEKSPVMKSIV